MAANNGQVKKKKLRLLGVRVEAQFALDDGNHLEMVQTNPIVYTAEDWENITSKFSDAMDELRTSLGVE